MPSIYDPLNYSVILTYNFGWTYLISQMKLQWIEINVMEQYMPLERAQIGALYKK